MLDGNVPFPVLLITIVAVVVSFVCILESQNTAQQCKQVKHFMAMMVTTTAGEKRTSKEADIDDTGRRKQRMIKYDCEHAKKMHSTRQPWAISHSQPSPILNHQKFQ